MKKKGFTLYEMLIVVGMIGILVSMMIPIFTSQLEKSREAVDLSMMRNCRAEMSMLLMNEKVESIEYYYDGNQLTKNIPLTPIGKGTITNGKTEYILDNGCDLCNYNSERDYTNAYLIATVSNKVIHVHWSNE